MRQVLSSLLVFMVLPCTGCRLPQGSAAQGGGEGLSNEELGASDLSLLVPLQDHQTNASQSVFGKIGSGICNAPTLDLGGDHPLMSRKQWQDWAKDSLLSVLPLPTSSDLWQAASSDQPALSLPARKKATLDAMRALPDVDSDTCPDAVGIDQLVTDDIDALRQAGTNVAVMQSLPVGSCRYLSWRVVSARFDPCSYRGKVLVDQPHALDPGMGQGLPAEACGGAELRLVVQPFIGTANGGYHNLDMAMHLFYKLADPAAYVQGLRELRRVSRVALAGKSATGAAGVWYADRKDMLIPHPGLREEMDCSGGDNAPGPVGNAWRHLLQTFATEDKLFKVTWVTTDNSGGNWSFGLRLVQGATQPNQPRQLTRIEPYAVETFTLSQILNGFPYTPFDLGMNTVDYFYRDGRTDTTLTSAAGKAATKELIDIANPDKTSFNAGGKLGASCASCHTRDQTERAVRDRTGMSHEQLGALASTPTVQAAIWDPFLQTITNRNDNNVRNFGYASAMTFGVSRRSINESEMLRRVVKNFFSEPQPAAKTPPPIAAMQPTPTYTNDIQPLLATRCGYCHGIKRSPALLQESTARAYASAIIGHVCADVLAYQHMPPGKTLPNAEKSILLSWAKSVSPAPIICESK